MAPCTSRSHRRGARVEPQKVAALVGAGLTGLHASRGDNCFTENGRGISSHATSIENRQAAQGAATLRLDAGLLQFQSAELSDCSLLLRQASTGAPGAACSPSAHAHSLVSAQMGPALLPYFGRAVGFLLPLRGSGSKGRSIAQFAADETQDMGLADHMSENVSNNGQSWRDWEPDHEPPTDAKPDGCCAATPTLPARGDLQSPPSSGLPNALAPLNHHNQVTRFMAKQTLGYIPRISSRSPERARSPPTAAFGAFTFDSPRGSGAGSPSFCLPSIGTPPLSPQKWASASPFADDAQPGEGRPSLPAFGSAGNFIQRPGSFSESCASPIPPLKRQHQETTHHTMSIADLCQPIHYIRALSCPSDTNPPTTGSNPSTPPEAPPSLGADKSWRPAIEPFAYMRTQSCSSAADTLPGSLPHSGPTSVVDDFRRNRLERSSSMDARMLNEIRSRKRPAEVSDLTQWLDRSGRDPLISLADSADTMLQLEQAGRSMHISDSPRSDATMLHEAKREKKLCAFPQCASNAVTRGLCISHGGGRRCQRKGCTRGAQSKGLCVAHGG